ncbi:hypothetical protein [Chlorobium limicola]|uniref:Uncharacterized protein n=1 Tax=Chlorobium limicola TaxID=1092 RepID=A0A101JPJ4_CHLLI|nr:hypothetical protein [Chlorobium limicola]KUL30578.1 hypothetical protein ASB62_03880 [Chlorobium limicola]
MPAESSAEKSDRDHYVKLLRGFDRGGAYRRLRVKPDQPCEFEYFADMVFVGRGTCYGMFALFLTDTTEKNK